MIKIPEETENYFHIPVKKSTLFVEDSFRTIKISKGVLAVYGKLKKSGKRIIQKFLLSKKRFKTMKKAKEWVQKNYLKSDEDKAITDKISIKALFDGKDIIYKSFNTHVKSFDIENRTATLEITRDDVDSVRERVMSSCYPDIGTGISRGRKALLFNHDPSRGIGLSSNPRSSLDGKGMLIDVYISKTEEDLWVKMQEGVLFGASIGFRPTKVVEKWYDNIKANVLEIHNIEYFETSLCFLPINVGAGVREIH